MRARQALVLALLVSSVLVAWAEGEQPAAAPAAEEAPSAATPAASTPPAATPPPAAAPETKKRPAADISVASAQAAVISAGGKKQSSRSADFGAKLLDGQSLDAGATVEITFTPKLGSQPGRPQQAMALLVPATAPALTAFAVAKASKDGVHTIALSATLIDKQLGPVGGDVLVTLLLGDPSAPKGVRWELGRVAMPGDGAAKPSYKSARAQAVNNYLPDIAHMFRAPDKRPPAVVSLAFTALALAPLALLLLWLLATGGLSLAGMPPGAGGLYALLFHGGIAALLALYWLFWTRLNLAQTLPAAGAVGLFTAAAGYKALSALADVRLAAEPGAAAAAKKAN